ncbi:MAG TPA: pentapeptide repeat-containing protein [Candidatus Solibacter sp.]|nr:pentapeptide repeat-containing protein [Candidatus Solibacter sp.]
MDCCFCHTNLYRVDFQGSVFANCIFEGELRQTVFARQAFQGESLPPNEMVDVDFSRASLRDVEFRELDLDRVRFPEDGNHVVVQNWRETLDRLIGLLSTRGQPEWRGLVAVLQFERKWIGPNQRQGVLNKVDLEETIGAEGLREFMSLLQAGSV